MASPILININNSILQSRDYSSTGRCGCAENLTPLARHGPRAGHPSMRACVLEQHSSSLKKFDNVEILDTMPIFNLQFTILTLSGLVFV